MERSASRMVAKRRGLWGDEDAFRFSRVAVLNTTSWGLSAFLRKLWCWNVFLPAEQVGKILCNSQAQLVKP